MRVLITGAGGVVGQQLAQLFLNDGSEVFAYYRNHKPHLNASTETKARLHLIKASLEHLESLPEVELIVHAAACTHLNLSATPIDFVNGNVLSTSNLLRLASLGSPKLFVFLSTISIYGRITVDVIDEATPPQSPDIYGATKYAAEEILNSWPKQFHSLSFRLPGIVSRGDCRIWLGKIVQKLGKGEPIEIYNSKSPFNNGISVKSLFDLIQYCHHCEGICSGTYLVASSRAIPVEEVVQFLKARTGSSSAIACLESAKGSFWIKTDKLERDLNYKLPSVIDTLGHITEEHRTE